MRTALKTAALMALVASSLAVAGQAAAQSYYLSPSDGYRPYYSAGGQPWRGYEDRDDLAGRPARELFDREDRLDQWIRRSAESDRLEAWQARRLSVQLEGIRRWTRSEAREHRWFLPAGDYARISQRLDQLTAQVRAQQERDDD